MEEHVLRAGKEISNSANARLRRAKFLYQELIEMLDRWRSTEPLTVRRVYGTNERTLDIYASLEPTLDLDAVGVVYGDLLHNLWSSHENLFHDILKLPGVSPSSGNHYFPACSTEKGWENFAKRYQDIPPVLLERIRRLQPYTDKRIDGTTDERYIKSSATYAMRGENNAYKHKSVAECIILRHEFYAGPTRWQGGEPTFWEASPDSDPFIDEPFRTMSVSNGGRILAYPIGVGVQVCVRNPVTGDLEPLVQSAATAVSQADFNIKAVCMGFDAARIMAEMVDGLDSIWYDASVLSSGDGYQ
ncbi:hypothetical protein [Sanguibacter sp. Z1732]|uniref:hypothetical protein n=1 Tax=Sanguibacter sp. Z1732 TaxID=3435412 RepID=UPI003D9C914B